MARSNLAKSLPRIDSFEFKPGRTLAGKYAVESLLGAGWESEVYKVVENRTGIPRAAKVFFPHRNVRDRAVTVCARKLDRLRNCPVVIQYHHSEAIRFRNVPVTCLISEFVEGELFSDFIYRQPGRRLPPFEALHLLYTLARGLEQIHKKREYHGDLHPQNVLVDRRGIFFDVKLVDLHHWGPPSAYHVREDVVQLIQLLHEAVGGRRRYGSQPSEIKGICRGLRRDLISERFPSARNLREHLESFLW
ncbi:MAG: protein kinase domain-containing protein [Planctomycetota bacterium]|jgi:hypothetical protein